MRDFLIFRLDPFGQQRVFLVAILPHTFDCSNRDGGKTDTGIALILDHNLVGHLHRPVDSAMVATIPIDICDMLSHRPLTDLAPGF